MLHQVSCDTNSSCHYDLQDNQWGSITNNIFEYHVIRMTPSSQNVEEDSGSIFAVFLSCHKGVHKLLCKERLMSIDFFGYNNQWTAVLILTIVKEMSIAREY